MEKISHIVRGNSRVSSVDLKSSSAVRPGVPSFGRPVGESPSGQDRGGTTASRAAALHAQLNDQRRGGPDRVVEAMADQFFMSRIRRPEEGGEPHMGAIVGDGAAVATEPSLIEAASDMTEQPEGYTPRGSYVDVRA